MTRDERLETVEELSSTVTNDLGLREQLEVIRIINPLADLPTTDSEFFIGKKMLLSWDNIKSWVFFSTEMYPQSLVYFRSVRLHIYCDVSSGFQ